LTFYETIKYFGKCFGIEICDFEFGI